MFINMDAFIRFTQLNDYIFCPVSIYFHNLYQNTARELYQDKQQIQGTIAHEAVDGQKYSSRKDILQAIDVISVKYGLVGKIDIYDQNTKTLVERKKKIKTVYDGYIFQLYAQYFAMQEMGYEVTKLKLYSMDDNKSYPIPLPEQNAEMLKRFEDLINEIKSIDISDYRQDNAEKCRHCIYEPACDRGMI